MPWNEAQKEMILEWASDRGEPFSAGDVEKHFGIHYQTAHRKIKELVNEDLIERVPNRELGNRRDMYVLTTTTDITNHRALKVQYGAQRVPLGYWAVTNIDNADLAKVCHAVIYLFIRSYYSDAPDHQHLRGAIDALAVRSFIANKLKDIRKNLRAIEDILSYSAPFEEGNTLAERFGNPPVGFDMSDALQKASIFSQIYNKEINAMKNDTKEDEEVE